MTDRIDGVFPRVGISMAQFAENLEAYGRSLRDPVAAEAPAPCAHVWTGRRVTSVAARGFLTYLGCKVPTCARCGMSKAYHDWKAGRTDGPGNQGKG
jgi:hypothetical protein